MSLSNRALIKKAKLELEQVNPLQDPDLSVNYLHRLTSKDPTIGTLNNLEADVICVNDIVIPPEFADQFDENGKYIGVENDRPTSVVGMSVFISFPGDYINQFVHLSCKKLMPCNLILN